MGGKMGIEDPRVDHMDADVWFDLIWKDLKHLIKQDTGWSTTLIWDLCEEDTTTQGVSRVEWITNRRAAMTKHKLMASWLLRTSLASNLRICMALVSTWIRWGAERGCIQRSVQSGAHVRCNRILTRDHPTKPRTSMLSAPDNIIPTENHLHNTTSIIRTTAMGSSGLTL